MAAPSPSTCHCFRVNNRNYLPKVRWLWFKIMFILVNLAFAVVFILGRSITWMPLVSCKKTQKNPKTQNKQTPFAEGGHGSRGGHCMLLTARPILHHFVVFHHQSLCNCEEKAYDQCTFSSITPGWLFGFRILYHSICNFPSVL